MIYASKPLLSAAFSNSFLKFANFSSGGKSFFAALRLDELGWATKEPPAAQVAVVVVVFPLTCNEKF